MKNYEYVEDLSIAEVKKILIEKNKNQELTFGQKNAYEHAKLFSKLPLSKVEKIKEELLKIEGMTSELAIKIIDVLPDKLVLDIITEKIKTISDEDKENILKIVEKYKK